MKPIVKSFKPWTRVWIYPLLLLLIGISFSACEKEEDDSKTGYNGDPVWENQFYFGNTQVNGVNTITSELETSNGHIKDKVCYGDLPSGAITSWKFSIYIPTNSDLNSGFETNSTTLFYNGTSLDVGESNVDLAYNGGEVLNGADYSVFSVKIQFPTNNLSANNFQALHFAFDVIHKDSDSGEEYNRDGKFIQIDIADCGGNGGGGGGDTSGYNCVGGGCQYVSSGAAYSSLSACENACGNGGGGGGGGDTPGSVTFYTKSDFGCGNISVTISGHGTQTISSYYSSGINGCNISGCANFTLPEGTYTYNASCSNRTWGPSSFTITASGCIKYELY